MYNPSTEDGLPVDAVEGALMTVRDFYIKL